MVRSTPDKGQCIEDPCEVKISRTVLKTNGAGDRLVEFNCVRVVWNDALAICKQQEKKPKSAELQKLVITHAKKTEARAWLSEVSNIPLQQSVADLEVAFKNFFDSCKGKRKGRKVGYPKFKKRTNSQSARLSRGGFSIKGESVYLAKIGVVKPIWSRELPSQPSSLTLPRTSVGGVSSTNQTLLL